MACAQTRVPTSAPASAASPPSADPRKPTSRSSPPCSLPSGTSATPEPSTTTPVQITSPASTPNEPRLGHSTNSKQWATASLSTAPTDAKDPSSHQKSSATLFPISVPYSAGLARLRLILSPKLQGESGQPGLGSSRPTPTANPSKRGAFRAIFNWTRQMAEEGCRVHSNFAKSRLTLRRILRSPDLPCDSTAGCDQSSRGASAALPNGR